jgi:hypothetical protein
VLAQSPYLPVNDRWLHFRLGQEGSGIIRTQRFVRRQAG